MCSFFVSVGIGSLNLIRSILLVQHSQTLMRWDLWLFLFGWLSNFTLVFRLWPPTEQLITTTIPFWWRGLGLTRRIPLRTIQTHMDMRVMSPPGPNLT